jgi:hypothetical protein
MRDRFCALSLSVLMLASATTAHAQLPGVPVLQNAFANPGLSIAVNYGHADNAKAYAGALGWAPRSARFQVTGGFGLMDPQGGDKMSAWGGRVSAPIASMMYGRLGFGAFAGVGGASRAGQSVLHVPAGASVSYRMRIGDRRGISLYAAPFYSWTRTKIDDVSDNKGLVRGSVGLDFAVVPSLGITVGYEFGQTADETEPGATGGVFGVGVTYALRRSP